MPSKELEAFNSAALSRKKLLSSAYDPVALREVFLNEPSYAANPWKTEHLGGATLEHRGKREASRKVVYVAGGGFCFPAHDPHRNFVDTVCNHLEASGTILHHRLAPEHRFPAAHEDVVAGLAKILADDNGKTINIIADSSGAALVLTALEVLRDTGKAMASRCVFLSPLTDLAMSGLSHVYNSELDPMFGPEAIIHKGWHYLQGANPTDSRASPLWGNPTGLPPMLLIAGSTETMLDDTLRYAEKINDAGGEATVSICESAPHVFPLQLPFPEAQNALSEILSFLD